MPIHLGMRETLNWRSLHNREKIFSWNLPTNLGFSSEIITLGIPCNRKHCPRTAGHMWGFCYKTRVWLWVEADFTDMDRTKEVQLFWMDTNQINVSGQPTALATSYRTGRTRWRTRAFHTCPILSGKGFHRHRPGARDPHFSRWKPDRLAGRRTPMPYHRRTSGKYPLISFACLEGSL